MVHWQGEAGGILLGRCPAPPQSSSTCVEQLGPTENPSTSSPGRASSSLSWKTCGRWAGTAPLQPCPGSADLPTATPARGHWQQVQSRAAGRSGREGVLHRCKQASGAREAEGRLAELASARCWARGDRTRWTGNWELCEEQTEVQTSTSGWWPAIAPFPRCKHL